MHVLVTGHRGRLGVALCDVLERDGHTWAGFDRDEGDIRDLAAVTEAARGCEAIIHLAGLADDMSDDQVEKMSVNVVGTWSVLLAAEAVGAQRVVNYSSGKALGMKGVLPAYLPIDDDHPAQPTDAYGLSKLLSEDLCEAMTRRSGMVTVCLRPVAVFTPEHYGRWAEFLGQEAPTVGEPWHMGVYVDLQDTARAGVLALTRPASGHIRLLIGADDIAADGPSRQLAAERLPGVEWRGAADRPSDAALVDASRAKDVLGWEPRRRWRVPA
jgi:nucleoside-diphosphate-sugar epimerase